MFIWIIINRKSRCVLGFTTHFLIYLQNYSIFMRAIFFITHCISCKYDYGPHVYGIVKSNYRSSSTLIYGGYKRNNKVYLQEK